MKRKIILLSVLFLALIFVSLDANAQEKVEFEGKAFIGGKILLTGILNKPKGEGPFPVVVMLHGCAGLGNVKYIECENAWGERFLSWGYVTFQVDSFRPRNYDNICDKTDRVTDNMRSYDAYSARSYLAGLEFIDPDHIAVIGWSHGGWTVMKIVDGRFRDKDAKPFQAAIAYYPWCDPIMRLDTPLLVLIGDEDDWCPASKCEILYDFWSGKELKCEFKLKVYANSYHAFDCEGLKEEYLGHHMEYNSEAATDAITQTKVFLDKYLKSSE